MTEITHSLIDFLNFKSENGHFVCLQVNLNVKNAKKTEFVICEDPHLLEVKYYLNKNEEGNLSAIIKNKEWKIVMAVGPFKNTILANEFKLKLENKSKGTKNRIYRTLEIYLNYKKMVEFSNLKLYITKENLFEAREKRNENVNLKIKEKKDFHSRLLNQYFKILTENTTVEKEDEEQISLEEFHHYQKTNIHLQNQNNFFKLWNLKKMSLEEGEEKEEEEENGSYLKNKKNIFTPTKFFKSPMTFIDDNTSLETDDDDDEDEDEDDVSSI